LAASPPGKGIFTGREYAMRILEHIWVFIKDQLKNPQKTYELLKRLLALVERLEK
jgi:hypothetical protein